MSLSLFFEHNDPTAVALGLAATWHPMHNGMQHNDYHQARWRLCDNDYDAWAAYDMGGELAPGGLIEEQIALQAWADFLGAL